MPLGISFGTFQSMGYLIDDTAAAKFERNVAKLPLFISYSFHSWYKDPSAGLNQLKVKHYFPNTPFDFKEYIKRDGSGFFGVSLQAVIADRLFTAVKPIIF